MCVFQGCLKNISQRYRHKDIQTRRQDNAKLTDAHYQLVLDVILPQKTRITLPEILYLWARAVSVPVGRRSGGRLATILVATINIINFFFFSFVSSFFLRHDLLS